MRPILRFWAGRCRYKDHKDFYLGTVEAESEMEALRKLEHELWPKISPHPFPDSCIAIPGMVIFLAEKQETPV